MLGFFENGCPAVKIKVSGVLSGEKEYNAILDTGFNGYFTLPLTEAFPLGLVLSGVQSSRLADGSISHYFVCMGKVKIDDKEVTTLIDVQDNCSVLIGTALLKKFGKELKIDFINQGVELVDKK